MDIEAAFSSTYKTLFGQAPRLRMDELAPFLLRNQPAMQRRKSHLSGREVAISGAAYPDSALFVSQDEIDFVAKPAPLNVNEIKDLDSLLSALSGRFVYAGNKTFGNSGFIEGSDNITDSFYVKNSHTIYSSKYAAYSSYLRDGCEYAFGSAWSSRSRFLLHHIGGYNTVRSFDSYMCTEGSDTYCSFNCQDCQDVMFSFNLKGRRNAIGNLVLPRDRYLLLKAKLLSEMDELIHAQKSFPSIFEFALQGKSFPLPAIKPRHASPAEDIAPVDTAFRRTCRTIFGSEIGGLQEREGYLAEKIVKIKKAKTPFGSTVFVPAEPIVAFSPLLEKRLVTYDEAEELSGISLSEGDCQSLQGIFSSLGKIAYYRANIFFGNYQNNPLTVIAYNSTNSYYAFDTTNGKYNAYCTFVLDASYCYGCFRVVHCDFCVRCHNCTNLSGCLEMDCCSSCRNSLYCHNCENLSDCMFCFSAKNLKYAVGNVEMGREKYLQMRELVLSAISRKMAAGERVPDIYSIGTEKPGTGMPGSPRSKRSGRAQGI